jgi:hypothetical protein
VTNTGGTSAAAGNSATGGTSPVAGASATGGTSAAAGASATGGGSSIAPCSSVVLTSPNGSVACNAACSLTATLTGSQRATYDCNCVSGFLACTAGSAVLPACPGQVAAGTPATCDTAKDASCVLVTTISIATITYTCSCSSTNSQWGCVTS